MTTFFQALDQCDHLSDMPGGLGRHVRAFTAKRIEILPQRLDVASGVFINSLARLLRQRNNPVFDVGDVHDVSDAETFVFQITAQEVGADGGAKISDVTKVPDRWSTVVELRFAIDHGT